MCVLYPTIGLPLGYDHPDRTPSPLANGPRIIPSAPIAFSSELYIIYNNLLYFDIKVYTYKPSSCDIGVTHTNPVTVTSIISTL